MLSPPPERRLQAATGASRPDADANMSSAHVSVRERGAGGAIMGTVVVKVFCLFTEGFLRVADMFT